MFRVHRLPPVWAALATAVLLLSADPGGAQPIPPEAFPGGYGPECYIPSAPQQHQVLTAQLGMMDWQRGYLAKVQGASSQNVLWIAPTGWPSGEPRRLLNLFKRRR